MVDSRAFDGTFGDGDFNILGHDGDNKTGEKEQDHGEDLGRGGQIYSIINF